MWNNRRSEYFCISILLKLPSESLRDNRNRKRGLVKYLLVEREHTFWKNVHPFPSVQLLQNKIHALLVNTVTWREHMMEVVRSADGRTETRVNANRDSPLQTGTHFPRLKNRECSSLVKQMSDAAGVLSTQRWIITHDRKKQHHTSFCNWLDAMWNSQTHHRILLKFHKCLSRSTPVTHRCDYVIYVTVWFHGRGHLSLPQMCGSSIQDWWLDRVMRGVSEGLWSIRSNNTSWLWTVK